MTSVVIFLFCLTYFHGVKSNASTLDMLQIDVAKNENIVSRTDTNVVYQFTNNEELIATCRRKKADGKIKLTWYKSGFAQNTTTEDKLELTFILNEHDGDTNLECRLRVEDSQNKDYKNYQEGKWLALKYTTSPMKKYIPSSVEPKTEEPPLPSPPTPPAPYRGMTINKGNDNKENDNKENDYKEDGNKENDNKVNDYKEDDNKENDNRVNDYKEDDNKENDNKENDSTENGNIENYSKENYYKDNGNKENDNMVYVYASITLAIILVILLLIFIMRKMNKKFKVSKENDLGTNDARYPWSRYDFYEDSGFQETSVYSVPYSQAEICSRSIPPVEAHKTLDTADYSNLIYNNYYYQNKINNQNLYNNVNENVPYVKNVKDCDNVHSNLYSI